MDDDEKWGGFPRNECGEGGGGDTKYGKYLANDRTREIPHTLSECIDRSYLWKLGRKPTKRFAFQAFKGKKTILQAQRFGGDRWIVVFIMQNRKVACFQIFLIGWLFDNFNR